MNGKYIVGFPRARKPLLVRRKWNDLLENQ